MNLNALRQHAAIGWDFDQTLIDAPLSEDFHRFILANPQIRHVIVTFRSGSFADTIWEELAEYDGAPTQEHFADCFNMSSEGWQAWNADRHRREAGSLTGKDTEAERYYRTWKGATCKAQGLTALVDDDSHNVTLGCELHGIAYFDSLLMSLE